MQHHALLNPKTKHNVLTLKAPIKTAADNILKYFFLIFQRKQVMIFHVADESREISRLVFFEKLKKIKINVICYKFCLAL